MDGNGKTCSYVKNHGVVPSLFINGEPFPAAAYMTYLEKFSAYGDFAKAGYRLFSVPVLFAGRWISATEGFSPFKKGIFDENEPDFSVYDESVARILAECPNAYIIPRVNVSMPVRWEKAHPDCLNVLPNGTVKRESFYSETWLADVKEMLAAFITYSENSPFADHIAGYQIAGGNTEEWFHFDLNGGACRTAEKGFRAFLRQHYPDEAYKGLPDLSHLKGKRTLHHDRYLTCFLEYANLTVASAVTALARIAKEGCGGRKVIGAFYGYSLEVTSPLHGTHALKTLLEDENTDFICSPNSYAGLRDINTDWSEMYPAQSVRLHGKMCFQECDVRTHLTTLLHERDPERDPGKILSSPIWLGPASEEETHARLMRSFARQLINGNGFWWFDMWGGWYRDEKIMRTLSVFSDLYAGSVKNGLLGKQSDTAVFIDETTYRYMTEGGKRDVNFAIRRSLGLSGIAYDTYDIFDFESVYKRYKAIVFLSAARTPAMKKVLSLCRKEKIPYLFPVSAKGFSPDRIRSFCKKHGAAVYCRTDDIVYIGRFYIAVFAVTEGEKELLLPEGKRVIKELYAADFAGTPGKAPRAVCSEGKIKVALRKGDGALFVLA